MSAPEGASGSLLESLPIDGTLHLDAHPQWEVSRVVPDYVAACRRRSIYEVHIVHGRRDADGVQSIEDILMRIREVACFRSGSTDLEAHGETTVILLRPEELPPT
ncbi:MAG: DNA mismatch repair protein MutS [Candidatus Krumholzibacteria bacterium]|nr:DNA mismatch repair protein MutS [Candidatus Krumholzibacteria bacterium]